MKKKPILLVSIIVIALSLISLSSCDVIDDVLGRLTGEDDTPAVCQHDDADGNGKCDKCNEDYTEEADDTTCQHSYVRSITAEPTCTLTGEEKYTCSKCDHSYTAEISKLSHTPSAPVEENKVEATCTTDGSYDAVVYCTVCDTELSREATVISARHSFVDGVCDDCGALKVSDGLSYELNDEGGAYTVIGIGECEDAEIFIPKEYNGLPVTGIQDWSFLYCESFTSINIPDSVTWIGDYTFYSCVNLTSVTIGNGVTSIGESAFTCCASLTSITIPDSITSIGSYAFSDCPNLKYNEHDNAYYLASESNAYFILIEVKSKDITGFAINEGTKIIYSGAFRDCTDLTGITIPDSVIYIGNLAFDNCTGLASIMIPESVTSIAPWTFYGCTSLTDVTIPEGVTSIGDFSFTYCTSLTGITIPDSVTSIEDYAFANCYSLTSIIIGDGIRSIGDSVFDVCSSLTTVYYRGSESEWETIEKGESWSDTAGDYTIIYGYEG